MFPAHAGMNRRNRWRGRDYFYVPRTRGDEPCPPWALRART